MQKRIQRRNRGRIGGIILEKRAQHSDIVRTMQEISNQSTKTQQTNNQTNKQSNTTQKSLMTSGISLSILTLFSRVLGLIREQTKARFLGTSGYADAFAFAFMIPNLCRRLFAENAVSVAFIPTFKKYLDDDSAEGKKAAREFVAAMCTIVSFMTALVVIAGMFVTPLIVRLLYKSADDALLAETTLLTRIMFPYLFVISVAAFFQGILNALKIFAPSGFTPILFNSIVIIATYILAPHTANPARAMSVGVIAGGAVQALFQMPFVLKKGWLCGFTSVKKAFANPGTKKVIALIGPTVIGMAAYQLNDLVSSGLAGRAGKGILSSLQYSLRLQELILGVFAVSIGTIILPDLSSLARKKDWDSFSKMLSQAIKIIALITIPISFYSFLTGRSIISLVYQRRSFTEESVQLTLEAFKFHIAGLFFIAANRIIAPAFYAQGNTKSPTIAGMLGFAANIAIALALVGAMKGGGIALALTIASLVNTVFLFVFLRKSHNINVGSVVRSTILYAVKMCVLSAIASLPLIFFGKKIAALFCTGNHLIDEGGYLAVTALLFGAIGIASLFLTNDPLIKMIVKKVKR